MNNHNLLLTGLSLVLIFTLQSCQKKPEVAFQTDISTKYTGEEIKFTNTTANGYYFLWDFGDGETSEETNPVHVYKDRGDYTVKLTAFSKNRRKSNQISELLTVFGKKEIKINDKSYSVDKGYLVDYSANAYFDILLVNSNIYISPGLGVYVYDRNKSGNILEIILKSTNGDKLDEGTYTVSGPKMFVGSDMSLDIQYFSGDYLYYECYDGTAEVNITGDTYEIEVKMTTTGGENVSVYYLGHLILYDNHKKDQKKTEILLRDIKYYKKGIGNMLIDN